MESHNEPRKVLCCGARTWSLVIGWLQTIGSVIGLLFVIISYFVVGEAIKQAQADHQEKSHTLTPKEKEDQESALRLAHVFVIMVLVISIITMLIEMVAGIFLIQGVNQQDVKKMKIWTVIQIVFLAFAILGGIVSLVGGGFPGLFRNIIEILVGLFCIWVVNLHKQELLAGRDSGVPVNYGVKA